MINGVYDVHYCIKSLHASNINMLIVNLQEFKKLNELHSNLFSCILISQQLLRVRGVLVYVDALYKLTSLPLTVCKHDIRLWTQVQP